MNDNTPYYARSGIGCGIIEAAVALILLVACAFVVLIPYALGLQ